MKKKFLSTIKPLLFGCLALSGWISFYCPSILFFGEYEYPVDHSE